MSLQQAWYSGARWPLLLLPLSSLFWLIVMFRRLAYQLRILPTRRVNVPVIIIGNITVGGSGKTPLVAWLVEHLRQSGWTPGIVSRGYGGQSKTWPQAVTAQSNPEQVGDEPVMLALTTGCPVAVAPSRYAAAKMLLEQGVDIIVADDGLQHYALARDIEIAVRDMQRGYGNRQLLPAGPLREPLGRLRSVDMEIVHGRGGDFRLEIEVVAPLSNDAPAEPLLEFAGKTVHAVAGIGNPQRFFDALIAAGIIVIPHPFPDHHAFTEKEVAFKDDGHPVLMTAKDAVKCRHFAGAKHWYVPAVARVNADAMRQLDKLIDALPKPSNECP